MWYPQRLWRETTSVDLEEQGCYKTARVTAEDTALVKACDAMNKWVSAQITYDWNGNKVVVDGDTIHEWIQVGDRGSAVG